MRHPVSKKIRFEVFKRDSFKCQYCGASAPDVILHVDHVKPVCVDGEDDILNLITSCVSCNLGKGPRELSDHSELGKQRLQLEALNEQRLQLEMLIEWRDGLNGLQDQKIDAIVAEIEQNADCHVTKPGRDDIRRWLQRYSVTELLEAAAAARTYLVRKDETFTHESQLKYIEFIPRIASVSRCQQKKPYLRDIYYIRGILRNRLQYVNDWESIRIMERAVLAGVDTEYIRSIALNVKNWTKFRLTLYELIEQEERSSGTNATDQARVLSGR